MTIPKANKQSAVNYVLFAFLCLFWGSTWISIKIGLATVPPLFFASTRFLAAGIILTVITLFTGEFKKNHLRLFTISLIPTILMISINYGLCYVGMTRVPSGISAVVNLSMVPLSATVFSVVFGQTRMTPTRLAAICLGIGGLFMLFFPRAQLAIGDSSLLGILAIALGAACYGSGSVLLKSKNIACPPRVLSAIQSLSGGFLLLLVSFLLEPISTGTFAALMSPTAFSSWAFLVIVGSVLAFTIYLTLLPRWGASRATAYAFVCPVIALIEGAVFTKENISMLEALATFVLLAATWFCLKPETPTNKNSNIRVRS